MPNVEMILKYYEKSKNGVCVYNNYNPIDSDHTSIKLEDNTLQFEFEDEFDNFNIRTDEISSVAFDKIGSTIMTIIKLGGTVIMIHSM